MAAVMPVVHAFIPFLCEGAPLFAEMSYSLDDPYAVTCDFGAQGVWVFARDLLSDGFTTGSSGDGDVRVNVTGNLFRLCLGDPYANFAILVGPRRPAEHFLHATYEHVPLGGEMHLLDFSWLTSAESPPTPQ